MSATGRSSSAFCSIALAALLGTLATMLTARVGDCQAGDAGEGRAARDAGAAGDREGAGVVGDGHDLTGGGEVDRERAAREGRGGRRHAVFQHLERRAGEPGTAVSIAEDA